VLSGGIPAQAAVIGAMRKLLQHFAENESGATAVEYGLIVAGISVAIITVLQGIGTKLGTTLDSVQTSIR
jgi:pilus assembly protein Flp/PilA